MAVSIPHSTALDTAVAPMPRRQSCDRCHERKVRCVTEGLNGTKAVGGVAAGNETCLGGHVIASVPCVRCKKAGAVCIYSPQLRSGRPRLRRDSSAPPPRKRTKRVSRCSSSSSLLSPTFSQPASPPSSSRPSTAVDFSSGVSGLGIMQDLNEHTYEHVASQIKPPHSEAPTTPRWDQGNGSDFVTPPVQVQWQSPPYGPYDQQHPADMCQVASFSEHTPAPDMACAPLYPGAAPNMMPTVESVYRWASPPLPEYFPEELAQISLRIFSATRALPPLTNPLAMLSSPAVHEVFDAACAFIDVVDRRASRRPLIPPEHSASSRRASQACADTGSAAAAAAGFNAVETALDASTLLLIHACHRAVLGVFEHVSASLLQHFSEPPLHARPPTPPDAPLFSQAVVMINLINHLLDQLDRAFSSLAIFTGSEQLEFRDRKETAAYSCQEGLAASQSGASGVVNNVNNNDHYRKHHPDQQHPPGQGVWQGSAICALRGEMELRQMRVRKQVRAVERLLRQPSIHIL